jgi:hypothetical protein
MTTPLSDIVCELVDKTMVNMEFVPLLKKKMLKQMKKKVEVCLAKLRDYETKLGSNASLKDTLCSTSITIRWNIVSKIHGLKSVLHSTMMELELIGVPLVDKDTIGLDNLVEQIWTQSQWIGLVEKVDEEEEEEEEKEEKVDEDEDEDEKDVVEQICTQSQWVQVAEELVSGDVEDFVVENHECDVTADKKMFDECSKMPFNRDHISTEYKMFDDIVTSLTKDVKIKSATFDTYQLAMTNAIKRLEAERHEMSIMITKIMEEAKIKPMFKVSDVVTVITSNRPIEGNGIVVECIDNMCTVHLACLQGGSYTGHQDEFDLLPIPPREVANTFGKYYWETHASILCKNMGLHP